MTRELCRKPFPGVGSTRTHCGISVSRSVVNGSTATQGVAASALERITTAGRPALVSSGTGTITTAPRRRWCGSSAIRAASRRGPSGARECRERTHPLGLRSRSPAWPRPSRRRPEPGLYDGRPAIWNNHLHPTQTAGPQPGVVARSSFTRRQGPIHAAGDARAPAFKPHGEPHPLPPSPNRGHHVPARANQKCKRRLHDRMDIPVRPGRVALHRHWFPRSALIASWQQQARAAPHARL